MNALYLLYCSIMKLGLLIIIILSLVLSWCWLQQNDDFEKKVKCYELWKEYINKLDKEEDIKQKESPNFYELHSYNIVMSVYSKEANTCILYFQEYKKDAAYERIVDLLSSEIISIKTIWSEEIDSHHNWLVSYLFKLQEDQKNKIPTE